jgi:hypothetical protein
MGVTNPSAKFGFMTRTPATRRFSLLQQWAHPRPTDNAGRVCGKSRQPGNEAQRSSMRVGVLGGGLQGCCTALALAERAAKVTLFDKNGSLLSRAAVANEGKIHLGYMYAGDPTLSTAKAMMGGTLSFAHFLERHLGQSMQSFSSIGSRLLRRSPR